MARKGNPELVQELMDGLWTMPQDEFNEKFETLNMRDKGKLNRLMNEEFSNAEKDFILYGITKDV